MLKLVKLSEKYRKQLTEMMDEWTNTGEKIIPYSSYVYVPANQAKEQIYNLLNIFQQIDKKSIGPKLPDDNFFYSE